MFGFFKPLASVLNRSDEPTPQEVDCFHQQVEEAVLGVDDSEGLDFAEDMEGLAMDKPSPVATIAADGEDGDWNP